MSVRSSAWNVSRRASDRRPAPSAAIVAIDVEDADVAQQLSARRARRRDDLAGEVLVGDDDRDVLAQRRRVGHRDRDRRTGNVLLDERHVELERRGRPAQAETLGKRRVELTQVARLRSADEDPGRAARMQERVASGAGLDRQVDADCAEDGREDALRREERRVAADDQDTERPRLVGQLFADPRAVHVRDLVDRELGPAERLVALGDGREARQEQRAQRRVLGRERVPSSTGTRRASSGASPRSSPTSAETRLMVCTSVLPAPSIASCRRLRTSWPVLRPPVRAPLGSVAGTCSRPWMRATSSTRSISRVTSSARHVGGRARKPSRRSTSKPSRSRIAPLSSALDVDARHRQHAPAGAT